MWHEYGKGEVPYRVLVKKREGKEPLGRSRLDETIILKWIFKK
jgi:hypothetical protein